MSDIPEPEDPSFEITGAIAGPPKGHKKSTAASVLGAVVLAGIVAALSMRKRGRGGPGA
jgi:hypothetical protein